MIWPCAPCPFASLRVGSPSFAHAFDALALTHELGNAMSYLGANHHHSRSYTYALEHPEDPRREDPRREDPRKV